MGLPEILITFKSKGSNAIQRSGRGIVAVILHDETEGGEKLTVYNSITEVDFTKWTKRNYDYLKLIYEGVPYRVIVYRMGLEDTNYMPALAVLNSAPASALPNTLYDSVLAWEDLLHICKTTQGIDNT